MSKLNPKRRQITFQRHLSVINVLPDNLTMNSSQALTQLENASLNRAGIGTAPKILHKAKHLNKATPIADAVKAVKFRLGWT